MSEAALVTVGHGRLDHDQLSTLLSQAGIESLVDIRRFPNSRHNPDVASEALASWLPDAGISYRWDERLGGRRKLPDHAPDTWWKVDSFRAYAAHTRTPEFGEAMSQLLPEARSRRTAVMCSEAVWWRCHRRIVADVVQIAHRTPVLHLMPDGKFRDHPASEGARHVDDQLVWDRAT